jgi:hypothetical protein
LRGLAKIRKINDLPFIDLPTDSKIFQRVSTSMVYIDGGQLLGMAQYRPAVYEIDPAQSQPTLVV